MRRPFVAPGISLTIGLLVGRFLSVPALALLFFLVSLSPLLWSLRGRRGFLGIFLVCLAGIGALRMHHALQSPPHSVSRWAQGHWVTLEGEVVGFPEKKEKGKRQIYSLVIRAESIGIKGRWLPAQGKVQVFLFNPSGCPSVGERALIRGRLSPPKEAKNPGEFDYRKYLALQGIHSILKGFGPHTVRVERDRKKSPWAWGLLQVARLRENCALKLDRSYSPPSNAFLKALLLGLRKDLPEEVREDFIKTSTAHLLAISGMNITLVAGSIFLLGLCLGLPQKGAALLGLLSVLGYVFLSGSGIPVVRAGWMTAIFFLGLLWEREKDMLNSLFFALGAILMVDPLALFQVGFQLSFLSVLALILLSDLRIFSLHGEWLQTGTVLMGTLPLCVMYFHVISWVSLFANALAIPLFHLAVLGGMATLVVGSVPGLGSLVVAFTTWFLNMGLQWIHFCGSQPWGYFHVRTPSGWLILAYYATLGLRMFLGLRKTSTFRLGKALATSLWLAATLCFFLPGSHASFALTALSVGQNEVLHIEFPGRKHWLFNAGRRFPSNQARWILNPYLRWAGVKHLQGIFLTDQAKRHTGGLRTLMENFWIDSLLFPAGSPFPEEIQKGWGKLRETATALVRSDRGDEVAMDGESSFHVIDVVDGHTFLLIRHRELRFLFIPTWKPGVLTRVLPRLKAIGPVNVLLLPSFGKPDSLQWEELISILLPDWVVLSDKKKHLRPLLPVLHREEFPFVFLSQTGALRFESVGPDLRVVPFRQTPASQHGPH